MDALGIFETFAEELREWGSWLVDGLNSNFFAALVGAAVGAWATHLVATRAKCREEIIREIHETNAAIVLCGTICRSFLVYKQQHVRPLVDDYHHLKRDFEAHVEEWKRDPEKRFHFQADMQTLPGFAVPWQQLEKTVYSTLSLDAATLNLFPVLFQLIFSLEEAVKNRNAFIATHRNLIENLSPE